MTRYNQPISDASVDDLLQIEGVTSVGEGLFEGERAIVVGVEREAVADRLPAEVEGFPVVWELEEPPSLSLPSPPLLPDSADAIPSPVDLATVDRRRPVPPGVSIGHVDVTAGTSGFLATDGSTTYQISNNHVLADLNSGSAGDAILQPGPADGGTTNDAVGSLAGYVDLDLGGSGNPVDVAWYEPSVDLDPVVNNVGEPTNHVTEPELGDEVTFSGRTSGLSTALVDKAHVAINVELEGGTTTFTDQFRIDTPLIGGDSGCPVVVETDDGPVPAGIGFAGSDSRGWCNYITNVEDETGLTILPADVGGGTGSGQPRRAGIGAGGVLLGAGLAGAYAYQRRQNN